MLKIILFFTLCSYSLLAHTVKPAYLSVHAVSQQDYTIKWKLPILNEQVPSIKPHFPSTCTQTHIQKIQDSTHHIMYLDLNCSTSLFSQKIGITNISKEMMNVIFHFEQNDISYFSQFDPQHTNILIQNKKNPNTFNTLKNYISLGIKHILDGYDHLLFILGLLLLIEHWKVLLMTTTAFTLSHSITLGATALGYIHPAVTLIEQLIALSILILAVEVMYKKEEKLGLSARYPWVVAFFFGLIHGFGFASVLSELGLPENHLLLALLSFNVGIEVGQLLFISMILVIYYLLKKYLSNTQQDHIKSVIIYFIGSMASYWLVERLF